MIKSFNSTTKPKAIGKSNAYIIASIILSPCTEDVLFESNIDSLTFHLLKVCSDEVSNNLIVDVGKSMNELPYSVAADKHKGRVCRHQTAVYVAVCGVNVGVDMYPFCFFFCSHLFPLLDICFCGVVLTVPTLNYSTFDICLSSISRSYVWHRSYFCLRKRYIVDAQIQTKQRGIDNGQSRHKQKSQIQSRGRTRNRSLYIVQLSMYFFVLLYFVVVIVFLGILFFSVEFLSVKIDVSTSYFYFIFFFGLLGSFFFFFLNSEVGCVLFVLNQ